MMMEVPNDTHIRKKLKRYSLLRGQFHKKKYRRYTGLHLLWEVSEVLFIGDKIHQVFCSVAFGNFLDHPHRSARRFVQP